RVTRGVSLTVASGLLILTFLLVESRGPDQARQMRIQSALQAMQLHDAELNRDVLLARAGVLHHYDSLSFISRKLTADLDILRIEATQLGQEKPGTASAEVAALADVVTSKLTLIEYLKSDNAVLRNSIAYVGESMRARGDRRRRRFAASAAEMEAAALSHVVVRFVSSPRAEDLKDAEAVIARVADFSRDHRDLAPLVAHGRLVLDVLPRLDALLKEIAESPTAARAEGLQRIILEYAGHTEARAQRFRLAMYLVALLLLGYVVFQVARLRARTRELRRQEMQLIQVNKMTSLGMLVSGVAHEVNNPNQLVLMNASVLASA